MILLLKLATELFSCTCNPFTTFMTAWSWLVRIRNGDLLFRQVVEIIGLVESVLFGTHFQYGFTKRHRRITCTVLGVPLTLMLMTKQTIPFGASSSSKWRKIDVHKSWKYHTISHSITCLRRLIPLTI
jgi:hypothetical protein